MPDYLLHRNSILHFGNDEGVKMADTYRLQSYCEVAKEYRSILVIFYIFSGRERDFTPQNIKPICIYSLIKLSFFNMNANRYYKSTYK